MINRLLGLIFGAVLFCVAIAANGQNISRIEYFIDIDPGYDSAIEVPITPAKVIDNLNFEVDITPLVPGFHTLYIRAKGDKGLWSVVNAQHFYKTAKLNIDTIVRIEYFIDIDPGFGYGKVVPSTKNTEITSLQFETNVTGLTSGFHFLYVRAQGKSGKWSTVNRSHFYLYSMPAIPYDIQKVEYFVDTDPGLGKAVNIPVTSAPVIDNISLNIDVSSLPEGTHYLNVRAMNSNGLWSLVSSRKIEPPFISVSANKVILETAASLTVKSNVKWKMQSDQNWITFSTSTGFYDGVVTMKAEPNLSTQAREAKIIVSGEDVEDKTVTVTQASPSGIADNSEYRISVFSNSDFTTLFVNNLDKDATIYLFDIHGRLVINNQIRDNQVDISQLAKGMYIVKICEKQNVATTKILKL